MAAPLQLEAAAPAGAGELAGLFGGSLDEVLALVRQLLDATPARVIVIDEHERLVYANDGFFAFTRLHPKQVLGRHIAQVIGADTYATYAPVRERLARGESVRWEGWTELAGQGRRYMREHLVPGALVPDATGPVRRATVAMSLDLTELKRRDAQLSAKVEQLQNTEALKSSIVDHALAGIVSSDEQGRIVEFNPAAEMMFGCTRESVIGRTVAEVIVPPRHREAHEAGMKRLRDGAAPRMMGRRVEMPALRHDGSEMPVEMVLWRAEVHGAAHYTASFTDLSERQRAAREIERQREQLRQSEKLGAMGTLLASVAHELNNPLAIVLGRAALLEDRTAALAGTSGAWAGLQADAQRIREAAERCGRIVRTFLNMARQRPGERSAVQLNDLARAAADILGYTLRSHGIRLVLALADELPPVHADGDQLGQIVLNLLVNAQQALAAVPAPERELHLSTGTRAGGAEVWLRVADRGPGVREELRARLFEPFFTTKPEGVGTGLGLAVSRSIAREHGGELVLEDSAQGASFCLTLPVQGARAAALPDAAQATATTPLAAAPLRVQVRVLVVDDEPEIAALVREMLESAGFDVATAESGAVALALLDEARFDAIVSDLHMPDIDGAALWRAVHQRQPALAQRMLFVTGDTLAPSVSQFLERTGCESLAKPFGKAALLARLGAVLGTAA